MKPMAERGGGWLRPLWLVCALLCCQQLALIHGHAHALSHVQDVHAAAPDRDDDHRSRDGGNDAPCVECLAFGVLHAAPPPAAGGMPCAAASAPVAVTVPPAPTFRRPVHFLSRAPPPFQG